MALRRPTLLFCVLTIVLGVNYEISRPSFPQRKMSDVRIMGLGVVPTDIGTGTPAALPAVAVRKKRHAARLPETSTQCSRSVESPDENVATNDRSAWCEAGTYLGEDIVGRVRLVEESSEGTGWTAGPSSPSSHCQPSKCMVSHSSSFHHSQPPFSPSETDSLPLSPGIHTTQLFCSHEAQNVHGALSHLLQRSILSYLYYNQSKEGTQKMITDDSHSDRKNGSQTIYSAATNACCGGHQYHQDYTLQRKPLECPPGSIPMLQELLNQTSLFSMVQALEFEEGFVMVHKRNVHNKSILIVRENCEKHLEMETTSNRERDLSLFCLCMTLLFCRSEDLKQKVMAPLLHTFKGTSSILDLVKRFLERLTGTSGSKGSCFYVLDKPTNGPADDSKKDHAHSKPLNTASHLGRIPLITPKQQQGCPKPADFASFIPIRPVTYTVFQGGFLPSLGLSRNDMSSLGSRLASFFSLPASCNVSRVRLAQTGFYYDTSKTQRNISNVHEVTCYSCGVSYSQWKDGDKPEQIHERLKPDCPHLRASDGGSISTNNSSSVSTNRSASLASLSTNGSASLASPSTNGSASLASLSTNGSASLASLSTNGSASLASSNASSGYGSMNGGSLDSSRSMTSDVSNSGADSFPSTSTALGGRPGLQAAAATPARNGQSQGPRMDSAVNRNTSDLATDCAAIFPSDANQATPAAMQQFTRPAQRDAAAFPAPSTNHSSFPGSGTVARSSLEERPPLSMTDAVYPQFSRLQDRQVTFTGWPLSHVFHPDHLVMQGFYYAGYADCIRCFYCGVGLKSWCEDDDVMVEHIRWRPSCGYILNTRGQHFVNSILQRIQASTPQQQNNPTNGPNQGCAETTTNTNGARQTVHPTPPTTTTTGPTTAASGITNSGRNAAATLNGELLKKMEDMGFDGQRVARAFRQLQQEGVTVIGADVLVGKICDLDTDGSEEERDGGGATAAATVAAAGDDDGDDSGTDLQTDDDGAEEALAVTAAESQRAQFLTCENKRLRERNRCRVCQKAKVGMIYMPCGHILACTECGAKSRHCSACGQYIKATANVYI